MKHNLGNFPHHQKTNKPKSKNAGKRTCYAVYEDWFEAFENELREKLATIERNKQQVLKHPEYYRPLEAIQETISEILGEDSK